MSVAYDQYIGIKQKALRINLNKQIYGSFAEIGAGQEVAANFFKAGGASNTIAKTMSAYDMIFSDAIYGVTKDKRYVSETRLNSMLEHEYKLLIERLDKDRGDKTTFFAFSNTVAALNYRKTNEAHGWMGVRFQLTPGGEYNEVILHMKMLDNENILQQNTIGTIGVNLMYGCFFYHEDPEIFLQSLMDDLNRDRIQIDMIRFEGPDFKDVDNRLMSLNLVKYGFTDIAIFGPDGNVQTPADALFKKNIGVLRGRFRPITNIHVDMLENGLKQFLKDPEVDKDNTIVVHELTLQSLAEIDTETGERDFLDRVDILCSMGQTVMISNFQEYYKLVRYLSTCTSQKIGLFIGYPNLEYIFDETHYKELPGGILESFATLFSRKVKLYVYPTLRNGYIFNCLKFTIGSNIRDLYQFLISNDKIEDIHHYNETNLNLLTDDVLHLIKKGEEGWQDYVPLEVATMIKERCLFGFPYCEV